MNLPIYLDYNATTPCDPRVVADMLPYFTEHCGNAASKDHSFGWMAGDAVESAREEVAQLVGASSRNIIFTSGATEAVNTALKGIATANVRKGNHIITAKTEHRSVLDSCAYLEENGCRVTYLDVGNDGIVSVESVENALTPDTFCIAVMYANNETGVINPIQEIGAFAKEHGICFFCDATQAAGKIAVDVNRDNMDVVAFSAHKMYGPKGIGALYIREGAPGINISPLIHGGGHERGLRSGTLNVPGIVGFGKAASLCRQEMLRDSTRLQPLRDLMEEKFLNEISGALVNGRKDRLPHVLNISFPDTDNEQLLLSLSKYLAMSRGSACSSNTQKPSHVLKAMGLTDEQAGHAIRISLGRFNTAEEVLFATDVIKKAVQKKRTAFAE